MKLNAGSLKKINKNDKPLARLNKRKRERVYAFYVTLCEELTAMGF